MSKAPYFVTPQAGKVEHKLPYAALLPPAGLRVGLFTDNFLPGHNGVITSILQLAQCLRRLGYNPEIVAPAAPGEGASWQPACTEAHGLPVQWVPSVHYLPLEGQRLGWPRESRSPFAVGTRARFGRRYDLIHTHTPLSLGIGGARLARRWNVPHVSTYHTHLASYTHYVPGLDRVDRRQRGAALLSKLFYSQAQAVIVPSQEMAQTLREYGVTHTTVIPTSIDAGPLLAAPDIPPAWPAGTRRLLTVGRLAREKRFDVVLRALALLPEGHLTVLGGGPERPALEALARTLGVAERVTFVGGVPWETTGAYYRQAEVFMFASDTETQGLVLLEAQLLGLPVVAVGARGVLSSVQHGVGGYLVPAGDAQALAERTQQLLQNPQDWAARSQGAREYAGRRTPDDTAAQIAGVYQRALQAAAEAKAERPRRLSLLRGSL